MITMLCQGRYDVETSVVFLDFFESLSIAVAETLDCSIFPTSQPLIEIAQEHAAERGWTLESLDLSPLRK